MKKVAIITARGGSKRIPRKNIKLFLGQPIIAYSIQAALTSNTFDEVMVSTDDEEIAEIAIKYGAKVPFFRSAKNSDDFASSASVIIEVIEHYKKLGKVFDYGCCIYPTAPFVTSSLLEKAFTKLVDESFDVVFPVLPFSSTIQRGLKLSPSNQIEMFYPDNKNKRSQDLEPAYFDSGQFYWFDVDLFMTKKELWTDNTGVVVLTEMEAQDIDNLSDWDIAEFKYKFALEKGKMINKS